MVNYNHLSIFYVAIYWFLSHMISPQEESIRKKKLTKVRFEPRAQYSASAQHSLSGAAKLTNKVWPGLRSLKACLILVSICYINKSSLNISLTLVKILNLT